MILIKPDETKVKIESLSEEEYWKLLKLKEEINEDIYYFHEHADSETLEKIHKHRDNLNYEHVVKKPEENHTPINHDNIKKTIKNSGNLKNAILNMNRIITAIQRNIDINPGRLMALTDGIFGMVMTLLIFGISIPNIDSLASANFLFSHAFNTSIGITIVSFVLLGSFWIYHHEFLNISSVNMPYLWLNIIFLGTISFIPFTTSLIGSYPHYFQPNFLFGLNILISLISFTILYKYAVHMKFLKKKPLQEETQYTYNTLYMIMALTVIVIILDFSSTHHFMYLYFFVPIISVIRDTRFKLKQM